MAARPRSASPLAASPTRSPHEHDRDHQEGHAEQPQRRVEDRLRVHARVEHAAPSSSRPPARRAGGPPATAPTPGCCRGRRRARCCDSGSCSAGAGGTRRSRCRSSRRCRRPSPAARADRLAVVEQIAVARELVRRPRERRGLAELGDVVDVEPDVDEAPVVAARLADADDARRRRREVGADRRWCRRAPRGWCRTPCRAARSAPAASC